MAGTCLLIRKTHSSEQDFERLKAQGEKLIHDILGKYFPDIRFYAPDPNSWLIHFRKNEEQKFIADKDGWMIFEGTVFDLHKTRVHNIKSLREQLKSCDNVHDFANSLDGHFVIKIYDARKKCYYIINDFIRYKTHFYTETQDYFCYSSYSYLAAMVTKPDADLHAINEYMWRYYILSERSFLKNIKRMEGASIHSADRDTLNIGRYWNTPEQYSARRFQEQTDKMVNNLQESARLLGQNYKASVDFTQGQDSRQIVAAMLNQNQSFSTFIFGKRDFYELRATEAMTQRYHIPHHSLELQEEFLIDPLKYLEKSVLYGSAEEPGQHLGRIIYMREQQLKFGNALCNGTEGRFYKNGLWDEMYTLNFYREPKAFNIDLLLSLRIMNQDYNERIFIPEYRKVKKVSRDYFYDMIKTRIKGMEHAPVSMQVDRFDINHWLNFGIVANNAANSFADSFSPLLFRRNLEDALKVPVKWKFNLSKFQRAVVYKLHPQLAAEKTDFAGVNMLPKNVLTYPAFLLRYGWHQSSRLRNKYLQKLGFHPKTHLQEAWDYLPVYKTLYHQIEEHAYAEHSQMAMQDLLSPADWNALREPLGDPGSRDLNTYEFVFKIVTMDRFYRLANDIHEKFYSLLKH